MFQVLKKIYEEDRAASFYSDTDRTTRFDFGKIAALNEKEIALSLVTPDGKADGMFAMFTDKLFRVETDGQYAEIMALLTEPDAYVRLKDENVFAGLLDRAVKCRKIVQIELCESGIFDVCGFVVRRTDDSVTVRQVDEYGFDDGETVFSLSDVSRIAYDTEEEKRIERLYRARENAGGMMHFASIKY